MTLVLTCVMCGRIRPIGQGLPRWQRVEQSTNVITARGPTSHSTTAFDAGAGIRAFTILFALQPTPAPALSALFRRHGARDPGRTHRLRPRCVPAGDSSRAPPD